MFDPPLSVRLLVLQPTPFCNINCDYCYLPHRTSTKRMNVEIVEAAVRNVMSSGLLGDRLSIVWHAGEPMVMPVQFYRDSACAIARIVAGYSEVSHALQTNGLLIDQEWCAFFRESGMRVGVSLDGPARIHDLHRKTRSGAGTHARVMRGVRQLQEAGIPFHAIAVVTRDSLDHADEIFDFFVDHDIRDVGFNIDELEGVNMRSSLEGHEEQYSRFLARLFERSLASPGALRIREFENMQGLILRGLPSYRFGQETFPDNAQVLPFAITSVDCEGNFSMFSPELLGQEAPQYRDFILGNVLQGSMASALETEFFSSFYGAILRGAKRCRKACDYFSVCGGGAPANKYYESGSFTSAETQYCRNVMKAPLRTVLGLMESETDSECLGSQVPTPVNPSRHTCRLE
jgi:uncharacterized protein